MWAGPDVLRPVATFLGHRGWQGLIADFTAGPADPVARAHAVAELVASRDAPPVLIACDASGPLALQAARLAPVAAVVWLAPLRPGGLPLRRIVSPWAVLRALLTGADVPRPPAERAATRGGEGPPGVQAQEAGPVGVGLVGGRAPGAPAGVGPHHRSGAGDTPQPPPPASRQGREVGGG
jgi:hypothetical protein